MRVSDIIARFLSLLDVAILLLGLFIVLNAKVNIQEKEIDKKTATPNTKTELSLDKAVELIWLLAINDGPNAGQCQLLDGMELKRTISTEDDSGIREEIEKKSSDGKQVFVILTTRKDSMDGSWRDIIPEIEQAWNHKVLWVPGQFDKK